MIKQDVINKIKLVVGSIAVIASAYLLQIDLVVAMFLIVLYAYLGITRPQALKSNFISLSLLFVLIFVSSYCIIRQGWSIFYIPYSVVPMLSIILFEDFILSLLLTLACAVCVSAIAMNNFNLMLLFLTSGVSSVLLAHDARKRVAVIRAGAGVGLIQVLSLLLISNFNVFPYGDRYLILFINGLVSGLFVLAILPVFEIIFRKVTNISLLELADFNHPLLQKMMQEAPGTYHHSLIVGNLSDAACSAVGAHALLARIGAYYHDIGKLSKPEYFSENQVMNESKHDTLAPTMSKLVIMNHVKEGLELAKKYKLNPAVTDFIQSHHGNSLVYYFYRRALEGLEEDQELKEDGFRYPGPKPNNKETAIVLLADSVEAATRALKDASPTKINELVHKIINNKFIDGQLDNCDLTLKDLEKIAAVFIHILSGIYHSRVTYPESNKDSGEQS